MAPRMTAEETAALAREALVFFNKKEEYETLLRLRSARAQLKESFKGTVVNEWAELDGHWRGVKKIMDGVRERVGGDDGILHILDVEGQEGLKRRVLETRDELGLTPILS
jgi:hypothetical protein